MGVALLIALAAHAACPERLDVADEAAAAVVVADLYAARTRLNALEEAFACGGIATSEELAQLWLLEAALATFGGDADGASDAFRAAGRDAPGRFIEDLGPALRESYERALAEPVSGSGVAAFEPTLAGWTVAVDGSPVDVPATLPEGLHLVQVGPTPDEMVFSRVILMIGGANVVVDTQLPPVLYRDPPTTQVEVRETPQPVARESAPVSVAWTIAGGAGLAVGRGLQDGGTVEPAAKPGVPLETGVRVRLGSAWTRLAVGTAPLLAGRYLYAADGVANSSPVALGGHLGGGVHDATRGVGGMVGLQWPSRLGLRGVGLVRVGDLPLEAEARLGVNVATAGRVEPAVEVLIRFATDLL